MVSLWFSHWVTIFQRVTCRWCQTPPLTRHRKKGSVSNSPRRKSSCRTWHVPGGPRKFSCVGLWDSKMMKKSKKLNISEKQNWIDLDRMLHMCIYIYIVQLHPLPGPEQIKLKLFFCSTREMSTNCQAAIQAEVNEDGSKAHRQIRSCQHHMQSHTVMRVEATMPPTGVGGWARDVLRWWMAWGLHVSDWQHTLKLEIVQPHPLPGPEQIKLKLFFCSTREMSTNCQAAIQAEVNEDGSKAHRQIRSCQHHMQSHTVMRVEATMPQLPTCPSCMGPGFSPI